MQEFVAGTSGVLIYFVIAASVALLSRHFFKIPDEIFRKILHCILLASFLFFVFGFQTWWMAVVLAVLFAVVVYPILAFFERFKGFSQLTTERKSGELKNSLLLVFGMFAVVALVCWGFAGDKYLVLAAVYAWGFGDAAAALIGKYFGKHKITLKYLDGKKSVEGSFAMFVTSFISVVVILIYQGTMSVGGCILISVVVALVSAVAELYSKNGLDTVICPLSAMVVLLPLVYLFGGIV